MAQWSDSSPQVMKIPVRAGTVDVLYAAGTDHVEKLKTQIDKWELSIKERPSPSQRDSLELARYAIRRWEEAYTAQRTANSVERLEKMIADHPRLEVRILAVARASWLKAHRMVGICTFRRTWCNNIALDAIAAHPALKEQKDRPISGMGYGLIHHVCSVAEKITAKTVWGECTQNSVDFYRGMVDHPGTVQDLIVMPAIDYISLKEKLGKKLKKKLEEKSHDAGSATEHI